MVQPYLLTNGSTILRVEDGASIPADEGNADFQAYQVWLALGNTPTPAPALPPFLASVQAALTATDATMQRVQEAISLGTNTATAADVVAFMNYRRALRTLLSATAVTALPTKPTYPSGT